VLSLFGGLLDRRLTGIKSSVAAPDRVRKLPISNACVEIKKANLYGGSHGAILGGFSNTAAVEVWWNTSFEWP
jgi:hypothetical protein